MKKIKYILFLFLSLHISCDKQSNPFQIGNPDNYQFDISMSGKARDFIIEKNVNAEQFSTEVEGNIMKSEGNDSWKVDVGAWPKAMLYCDPSGSSLASWEVGGVSPTKAGA